MPPIKRPPHQRQRTFIQAWRDHRHLSLEAVADRIGYDHSTIQRLEQGKSPYNQDLLEKLAEVYGVRPADLIDTDPDEPEKEDPLAPVIERLQEAPESVQTQAIAVLDVILKTAR